MESQERPVYTFARTPDYPWQLGDVGMVRIGQARKKDSIVGFRTSYHLTDATGRAFICRTPDEFHATIERIRQRLGPETSIEGYAVVDDYECEDSIIQDSTTITPPPSLTA